MSYNNIISKLKFLKIQKKKFKFFVVVVMCLKFGQSKSNPFSRAILFID